MADQKSVRTTEYPQEGTKIMEDGITAKWQNGKMAETQNESQNGRMADQENVRTTELMNEE
jgi:hypothetical protein